MRPPARIRPRPDPRQKALQRTRDLFPPDLRRSVRETERRLSQTRAGPSLPPLSRAPDQPRKRNGGSDSPLAQRPVRPGDPSFDLKSQHLGPRGRWIVRGLVLAIIVAGLLIAVHQGNLSASPTTSRSQTTPGQAATPGRAGAARPATPQPESTQTPPPTVGAASQPQDTAAAFLAAYFSWSASESDQAYIETWRTLVQGTSVADLAAASPRLALDGGNDDQAKSTLPSIPASAVTSQREQAHILFAWTILVLPAGGELVQWEPRSISATIDLLHTGTGWAISNIGWTRA